MSELLEFFGEPIHVYTRAQALRDGVLVDVTEWASAETGFHGGFRVGVAVTAAVWADLCDLPAWVEGYQDLRGRAHDLLWMAALAARRGEGCETKFDLILPLSGDPAPDHEDGQSDCRAMRTYKLVSGR